ncbi:MAG: transcription antitermination factor NusB [Acidobacteriota bacterium]
MSRRRQIQAAAGTPTVPKRFRGRRTKEPRTYVDNVRGAAAWVVDRTLATMSPSSAYLESALERLDELDHALLRELALGTLRWLRRLDDVISQASNRDIDAIEPALRSLLRVGAYQLLLLDRVPAHAAVHEAVEQARRATHKGGASFTNAVLRRIARQPELDAWPVRERDPVRRLAIEKSHPDFLVRRWVEAFGRERTEALLDANNRPKALQLLAFRDRGGREMLAETLIDQGIDVEPSALSPLGLIVRSGNPLRSAAYRAGEFYVQDAASQASALIPPPRRGERILDAAAAPGGKGFSLLAHDPSLEVVMGDVSPGRLARLRANLTRLGREVPLVLADAGKLPYGEGFDRVILDLPCTGTGTLRKHPELKWRISEREVGRLSRQAMRLLESGARHLAEGGLLVAITCSLEPEENEQIVERLLDRHDHLAPVKLEDHLHFPLDRHIRGPGSWRILPAADHDGFTVHVLERRRSRPSSLPVC